MWGRWNLPIFLFRDGLLALMYRASLMVLVMLWSSLPNILKFSMVTVWPEMLWGSYIGEGAFRCSLNLSAKVLADSPMYSHHTPPCHICICIWLHFFKDWIFVLCSHEEVLDGGSSFLLYFYVIFPVNFLETFTHSLMVWYYVMWFLISAVVRDRVLDVAFVLLWGWCLTPQLDSVEGLCWICASFQTLVQMLFFFLQLMWARTEGFCPAEKGANHTVLRWNSMMAIPMQILVCVCWLFLNSGLESVLFIWCDQHIQKGNGAIFTCKLNVVVDGI